MPSSVKIHVDRGAPPLGDDVQVMFLRCSAMRWVSDVPRPGVVEIEFPDADGRVRRLTEKSSVVDADGRLQPTSRYPLEVHIACRPHHQEFRPADGSSHPCVDLTPSGVCDASELFTVERSRLTWGPPAAYSDLSIAARQAVALVTFRRWRRRIGMGAAGLDALDGHLWVFATVHADTFNSWYQADPLTRLGSDPLPDEISLAATSCGVSLPNLRQALESLIEITYGGLFGRVESSWSLRELQAVGQFTSRDGVSLVEPDGFIDSLWVDDAWGRPSTAQVARWRSID